MNVVDVLNDLTGIHGIVGEKAGRRMKFEAMDNLTEIQETDISNEVPENMASGQPAK